MPHNRLGRKAESIIAFGFKLYSRPTDDILLRCHHLKTKKQRQEKQIPRNHFFHHAQGTISYFEQCYLGYKAHSKSYGSMQNIITERTIVKDFERSHLADLYSYRSDPVVCRYQSFMIHSDEELEHFFNSQQGLILANNEEWKQIAITDHDNNLLGDCAVKTLAFEKRIAEIGIALSPQAQGKGYASEALSALFEYLFENKEIHKVIAEIDIRNQASINLFERLGFSREALLRKHFWDEIDNDWFDELHYGLLKEDFFK